MGRTTLQPSVDLSRSPFGVDREEGAGGAGVGALLLRVGAGAIPLAGEGLDRQVGVVPAGRDREGDRTVDVAVAVGPDVGAFERDAAVLGEGRPVVDRGVGTEGGEVDLEA